MTFQIKPFNALSTQLLFNILRARVDTFVVEQNCPYPELDDYDTAGTTQHVYLLAQDEVVAYARCYERNGQYSAIGRVLVTAAHRGNGTAKQLVKQAIACCVAQWPEREIYIGAQTYLLHFYQAMGFVPVGEQYLEDGIAHQDMTLNPHSL